MSTFVVETDEEGFTRALIGPFKDWDTAQSYANEKFEAYTGWVQEPYTVINASAAPK